jgi:hypothetical protein
MSLIGPIAVNKAEPGGIGDSLQANSSLRMGAAYNNPAAVGTGLLPQDYPKEQIKYVDLDLRAMTSKFMPSITIPPKPFQGTLGVAPPDGYFPALSRGVTNAVPPGTHAGNLESEPVVGRIDALYTSVEAQERSSIRATAMPCSAMARDLPQASCSLIFAWAARMQESSPHADLWT